MTSHSKPDWLKALIAEEGESQLISAADKHSLANALAAAGSPEQLEPHRHAQLLAAALGEPEPAQEVPVEAVAPSDEERSAAARLGEDLESQDIAKLLRAAYCPTPISQSAERTIRLAALSKASQPRRQVRIATLWGVLAAAASVVLWFATLQQTAPRDLERGLPSALNYAQSRSTDALFSEPFAETSASARIDRIAQARQRELRENRYLK
jgi:hypothetical protein